MSDFLMGETTVHSTPANFGTLCSLCGEAAGVFLNGGGGRNMWRCEAPACVAGAKEVYRLVLKEDVPLWEAIANMKAAVALPEPLVREITQDTEVLDSLPVDSIISGTVRTFATGATRDADVDKYDYEGFLSPTVLERFAEYMHANRVQSNGDVRDSDNWQKGIPRDQYMKSMFRHFMDVWGQHRASAANDTLVGEDALCALLFNVMGYLHETLQWEAE